MSSPGNSKCRRSQDYPGFDKWFNKKSEESVYVCRSEEKIVAFLYLKREDETEPYPDIDPTFKRKRRLKIGTMKVELNGYKIGERFLKIVFDNAIRQRVAEIYVTIFPRTLDQQRLIELLKDFGFVGAGVKRNRFGEELSAYKGYMTRPDLTPRTLNSRFLLCQSPAGRSSCRFIPSTTPNCSRIRFSTPNRLVISLSIPRTGTRSRRFMFPARISGHCELEMPSSSTEPEAFTRVWPQQ